MRVLKIASLLLAAVIAVAVLLLMIGIPSSFVTSAIQARVERDTGYRIKVAGATRLGLWPAFNITMHDVTLDDPNDLDVGDRLKLGSIEAELSLQSLLSGKPHVSELIITRPVVRVPLLRERTRPVTSTTKTASSGDGAAAKVMVDRVTLIDGALIMSDPRNRVENRIGGIGAVATISPDRLIRVTGSAQLADKPVTFEIRATAPATTQDRPTIPVQLIVEAPDLLPQRLGANADVRLNGTALMINSLTGSLGDQPFNGWASVDLSSKPLVKLDLDFQKLLLGAPSRGQTTALVDRSPADKPWSNEAIDLSGLNYADAQVRISAAQLDVGDARFAPAAIDALLSGGVLKASFANLGVYGGEADGEVTVDVSSNSPVLALRADLNGIRALPLLAGIADFDKLDGKMQAKIGVRSTGASLRSILSNLAGAVFVNFQDGAIRGINVAQMIRSLTANPLSGWQDGRSESTDLTQLSASFRIERGQAATSDLTLVGPLVRMTGAGTIDLAAKALALRVEPKLVLTLQGQGAQGTTPNPVGLGIPVVVQGPWSAPQFYPDMQGILDNPDAAYAKLREMGKGLFSGAAGTGMGNVLGNGIGSALGSGAASDPLGGKLGDMLGGLIQQGLGQQGSGQQGSGQQGGNRSAAPTTPAPDPQAAAPAGNDQNPMNAIMKQLFGR